MELRSLSAVPRLRKCYGWLSVPAALPRNLPSSLRPPPIRIDRKLTRRLDDLDDLDTDRMAIVYEYVESKENELAKIQEAVDFFHLAGFHLTVSLRRNWEGGVLLDLSDIVNPYQTYWNRPVYQHRTDPARILSRLTDEECIDQKRKEWAAKKRA